MLVLQGVGELMGQRCPYRLRQFGTADPHPLVGGVVVGQRPVAVQPVAPREQVGCPFDQPQRPEEADCLLHRVAFPGAGRTRIAQEFLAERLRSQVVDEDRVLEAEPPFLLHERDDVGEAGVALGRVRRRHRAAARSSPGGRAGRGGHQRNGDEEYGHQPPSPAGDGRAGRRRVPPGPGGRRRQHGLASHRRRQCPPHRGRPFRPGPRTEQGEIGVSRIRAPGSAVGDGRAYAFPRALAGRDDVDFSFSGLKTAVASALAGRVEPPVGDELANLAASVQAVLEELADTIADGFAGGITLLVSATEVDKRRSFYKTLSKRAELHLFDKLDSSRAGWEEEATEVVQRLAKKRKLQFENGALELFVLLTGGDTRQIENELEKIDIYLADKRRVDVDLVRALVPLSRAGIIFELSNALGERDLERALRLVRRLLDQGESAIGILLVAVLPTVRNLLLAKDLMERHRLARPHVPFQFISAINRLPSGATEHLPRKKDGSLNAYVLGLAAQNAHRFETEQLIAGMQACLEANLKLVTTQLEHELILTELVVKLLGTSE